MHFADHKFARIMSDIRIEESIRHKEVRRRSNQSFRRRLGFWLISRGERLAQGRARIA